MVTSGAQGRSPAVEDYCKAIYTLQARARGVSERNGAVSTNAVADRLGITAGSVSAMLRKLEELGLVSHVPYRGVRLTGAGKRVALEVIRHHRLLELFLAEALQMPWDRVHAEAEILEHVISEDLEELIATKLGHPSFDPHGDPIPTADLTLEEDQTYSLESLSPGDRGVFVRVSDQDSEMLRYLSDRGIFPGDQVTIIERQPFGGPVLVGFGRVGRHAIGGGLARAMRVRVADIDTSTVDAVTDVSVTDADDRRVGK